VLADPLESVEVLRPGPEAVDELAMAPEVGKAEIHRLPQLPGGFIRSAAQRFPGLTVLRWPPSPVEVVQEPLRLTGEFVGKLSVVAFRLLSREIFRLDGLD